MENFYLWLAKTQAARRQWWERNGDLFWALKLILPFVLALAVAVVLMWNLVQKLQKDSIALTKTKQELAQCLKTSGKIKELLSLDSPVSAGKSKSKRK